MLLPLKEQISELFTKLEQEKKEREDGEKEIIRNINDNIFDLNDKLTREKEDITEKLNEFNDNMLKELEKRDKMIEEYKNKSNFHLKELSGEIYAKMENTFDHQNKIIDDISNFLKTFQDTLKIMGKEG